MAWIITFVMLRLSADGTHFLLAARKWRTNAAITFETRLQALRRSSRIPKHAVRCEKENVSKRTHFLLSVRRD